MRPGTALGPYEVVELIGVGGMGEVYRARDTRLERDVALKVLPRNLASDSERQRRFEREARAAGSIAHPNIVAIYDVGNHEGTPFVVQELLEGETLRRRLVGGPLPGHKAVDLAIQIAQGLVAAHERGLVHRDLKPENIFITRTSVVKILDFGLAKLASPDADQGAQTALPTEPNATAPGTVMGTLGYMAPEQLRAHEVDHRADIFSFGAILFEVLTGRRAFSGDSVADTITAVLKEEPPELTAINPKIAPAVDRVVRHCLEKRREDRFQSARDLSFALEALSLPTAATSTAAERLPRLSRRTLRRVAVAMALIACTVAGWLVGRGRRPATAPEFRQLTFRRGLVTGARFAGDGIVYSALWDAGSSELFLAQPGASVTRALGVVDARIVAASRAEVMVLLQRSVGGFGTLARVPLDTGAPRALMEGVFDADWNAADDEFAVIRPVGGSGQIEYPIGSVVYTSGGWMSDVRISPDGQQVAYVDHPVGGDTRGLVAIVDRSGSRRTLSPEWKDIGGLAWSPDGREVWFTATNRGAGRSLHAVDLAGRQRLLVRTAGSLLLHDLSPTGEAVVSHPRMRWELRGRSSGAERDYSWLDGTSLADLSADGRWLLFGESGEGGGPSYSVFLRALPDGPPVRLGDGLALALSPDATHALALVPGEPQELRLLPTGAGQPRTLARGSIERYHWATFLPDGQRVLLVANQPGRPMRLFLQDCDEGEPAPFTPEGIAMPPTNTITPDGKSVMAQCPAGVGARFCIWPLTGGAPTPVPQADNWQPLGWSTGDTLWVRGPRFQLPLQVATLSLVGDETKVRLNLAPPDPAGVTGIRAVAVSAAGDAYAYGYQRTVSDLFLVSGVR